jgi:hypothetical protein
MQQYTMDMFGMSNPYSSTSGYTASNYNMFDTSAMGWSGIIGYTLAIILILVVILILVNYTIMPIFQFEPGGDGYIRIPYMNMSETYWPPDTSPYTVPDISRCNVNISQTKNGNSMTSNWSMSLDICIMNPLITTTPGFRLLFNRGGQAPSSGSDTSITSVITGYNLAMGLQPNTNDLIVSVMNEYNNPENIVISNVPTQTPFRIGVVVMDSAFEVYINGKLSKTRKMAGGIKTFSPTTANPYQNFSGPQGSQLNSLARVGNLILWTTTVTPSVMKYATPTLMPLVPSMDSLNSAAASSCGASDPQTPAGSLVAGLSGLDTATAMGLEYSGQASESIMAQGAFNALRNKN